MSKPILLYNSIYSYTAEVFTQKLQEYNENEPVDIWVNSPGGSVFAGWSMIAALQDRKGQSNAKVMGMAASMAFYMLLFMDNVEALDVATFMIHRADGYTQTDDEKNFLKDVNSKIRTHLEKRVDSVLFKEVTGVSFDEIFSMENRKDVFLNAKQAKKIGLVDKIIRLETKQIEAMTNEFFSFGTDFSNGIEDQARGSVDEPKHTDNHSNKPKIVKKMDLQTLRAEHPDLVNAIRNEEMDRVNAYLQFSDIDIEAVKKGIESGKPASQSFFAEMTRKGIAKVQLENIKADAPVEIDAKVETPGPEADTTDFEKEVFTAAGIEGKEAK